MRDGDARARELRGRDASPIRVVERMPLVVPVTDHDRRYLTVKHDRMGHLPIEATG